MMEKGFENTTDFIGKSVPLIGGWGDLDLSYKVVAEIDQNSCIHCGACYVACDEGAHQSIGVTQIPIQDYLASAESRQLKKSGKAEFMPGLGAGYVNRFEVIESTCVGCNLCSLVCPVDGCISMEEKDSGLPSMTWGEYQQKLASGEMKKISPPEH